MNHQNYFAPFSLSPSFSISIHFPPVIGGISYERTVDGISIPFRLLSCNVFGIFGRPLFLVSLACHVLVSNPLADCATSFHSSADGILFF